MNTKGDVVIRSGVGWRFGDKWLFCPVSNINSDKNSNPSHKTAIEIQIKTQKNEMCVCSSVRACSWLCMCEYVCISVPVCL